VNDAYTEIAGNLEQGGRKFAISFGRTPIAPAQNSLETIKQKYDKQEVYITMRDGIRLFTSIILQEYISCSSRFFLTELPMI